MFRFFCRSTVFLAISFITGQTIFGQPKRLQFMHLTPDEGLPSSIVSCIHQDHKGFIWIGTPDGLNRYDGFNFVLYKKVPFDPTSLPDNVVKTIFEDHNKQLFIGTENGLSSYNRAKDSFYNYMASDSSPMKAMDCMVSDIIEDTSQNLWLATNAGLIYFDRGKNQIKRFIHDEKNPGSLSNDYVEAVRIDLTGQLWVVTRKGINLFQPEMGTFTHVIPDAVFTCAAEDNEGNMWLGSNEGLYRFTDIRFRKDKFIHYSHKENDSYSLSIDQVSSLFVDDAGNLWIGTENGGLDLFDKKNNQFWHYRKEDYDPQSISNESIESIYQDKTGNLWFGTYTGGLNITMKNSDAIIKYQNIPGAVLSLSHNTVTSFLEDHKGQIWVATDGGGINLFDPKSGHFSHYSMGNSNLNSNAVLCFLDDPKNNQIWIGTWAGGLVTFNTKTKSFSSYNSKNSGIQDNNIYTITEGYDNDLWMGSFEHGLIHYQIREKKFTSYNMDNSAIGNMMVVKIAKFTEGRFLIGTTINLQIFDPRTEKFTSFNYNPDNPNSLSYPRVTDFIVVNDTCVWVGTPDGLNRFNPEKGIFTRYLIKNGLPNTFIKGIIRDDNDELWVTTNGGVCRFNYNAGKFKNFTKADGFQSNEFSERAILKTKNGALLMGGTKGFNLVYPEKITENKSIPEVLITDLKILNKSVKPGVPGSPLVSNITETKSLILNYDVSVLTFSFAVMDFSAPGKNQYAYRMENFDKNWIYPGNKGEATYTSLDPGEYVFRVKGSNNDGLWTETGTSIRITILPPWWNTWWFRLSLLFAISLILAMLYLTRIRHLKQQKVLLEKLVAIKTAELKDMNASKDKFFSIIAHDLKNPFNTIVGFSEILKDELTTGNAEKTKEYAGMINFSAVRTLKLLENLLEWANSQRGKILFSPEQIDLKEIINEEINALNDIAFEKNISVGCSIPHDLKFSADKNMLKVILRNLISNAIKFTHRNGIVTVSASNNLNEVLIDVTDNGIGMDKETISKLFKIDGNLSTPGTENEKGTGLGLFLCKEFVEKHGGKIWAVSEPGKGSTFKFSLPFNH